MSTKTTHGPRKSKSRPAEGTQQIFDQVDYQQSFDADRFNKVLDSQGIQLVHFKAIGDPRGMSSRGDNRDSLNIKPKSSDGFIYKRAGCLRGFFSGSSKNDTDSPVSSVDSASAYITVPTEYDDSDDPVILHSWDKFYLADIETRVVSTQFVEARYDGVDRLHFPAVEVTDLIDANGVEYEQGEDFDLTKEGWIRWKSQKRPGFNTDIGRGTVYSVRYYYTPYFVIDRLIHEIRVANITNPATFERSVVRMPYQVYVLREFLFLERYQDQNQTIIQPRDIPTPPSGGSRVGPIGMPTLGDKPKI